jgi:hypothetical protein
MERNDRSQKEQIRNQDDALGQGSRGDQDKMSERGQQDERDAQIIRGEDAVPRLRTEDSERQSER